MVLWRRQLREGGTGPLLLTSDRGTHYEEYKVLLFDPLCVEDIL